MTAAKRLKAGVIGLGVGEQHVKSYQKIEDLEVVAVCDLDIEHARRVAGDYGIAECHTDALRITEHREIDVVSICSFDDYHADQAISAFRSGKHVMVEKPVALTREEADRLVRAQQDSGRLITSNLILRQSPRFIELREAIRAGKYGDVFAIEGDYLHDILWKITEGWRGKMHYYSTVFGGGIHLLDLMRWLLGEEIVSICGMGNKVLTRGGDYRFNDSFIHVFRFECGALGKCMSTFGPQRTKFHSLNVYGSKRSFVNDLPDAKDFAGDRPEDEGRIRTPYPGMRKGDLLPDFVSAIREGREPNVSARDVFRIMDVCFAAMEAVAEERNVDVSYSL